MRTDYRSLEVAQHVSPAFERFLNDFDRQLNDPNVDNYSLVCETIYELESGEKGYHSALERAFEQNNLAAQAKLVSMDPRYVAQEPEYYGDIDLDRYERNKPIHWLWTYFDKLPIGRNTLFGFPFRRILGRYMFASLGENVKIFHNVEFTYGYNLFIEDGVVIHRDVMLDDRCGIYIKKNASISDFAHIYSHGHHADDIMDISLQKVVIGEGARVTYHSTVLAGNSLGDNSILGAMGLATKNIPDNQIRGGIPAKEMGLVRGGKPGDCC